MKGWLALAILAGGCAASGDDSGDFGIGDLTSAGIDISGRWASALELHGSDGSTLVLYALWAAVEPATPHTDGSYQVINAWQLCSLTLPGPLTVPFDDPGLAEIVFTGPPGSIAGSYDGALLTQPTIPIIGGAMLKGASDPLPADAGTLCGSNFTTDCVTANPFTGEPGLRATATGLLPDADTVDVDFKLLFAFHAPVDLAASTLNGPLTSASLDSHVLGCHLRSGSACSAADVKALEAARPKVSYTSGTLRSHYQGTYFACPQLLADPEGSLTGLEPMDLGTSSDAGFGTASFPLIQSDVDFMGCASGGCHEARTAPGQMHLFFQPSTDSQLRANYGAILPWTEGPNRFVNEVPLPAPMRARWTQWIGGGAPF